MYLGINVLLVKLPIYGKNADPKNLSANLLKFCTITVSLQNAFTGVQFFTILRKI
jgi:hypothetical protein